MTRILSVGLLNSSLRRHNEHLRKAGFSVSSCGTASLAANWLGKAEQFDVLIIDHTVPRRPGKLLIERAKAVSPEIRIILLSPGDSTDDEEADAIFRIETGSPGIAAAVRHLIQGAPAPVCAPPGSTPQPTPARGNLLHIAANQSIAALRTNQLRAAGYAASGAVTLQQIDFSLAKNDFDLIIVGPAIGVIFKTMIAGVVRHHAPDVKILEIGITTPVIRGANSTPADSGEDLLNAIRHALCGNQPRSHGGRNYVGPPENEGANETGREEDGDS